MSFFGDINMHTYSLLQKVEIVTAAVATTVIDGNNLHRIVRDIIIEFIRKNLKLFDRHPEDKG